MRFAIALLALSCVTILPGMVLAQQNAGAVHRVAVIREDPCAEVLRGTEGIDEPAAIRTAMQRWLRVCRTDRRSIATLQRMYRRAIATGHVEQRVEQHAEINIGSIVDTPNGSCPEGQIAVLGPSVQSTGSHIHFSVVCIPVSSSGNISPEELDAFREMWESYDSVWNRIQPAESESFADALDRHITELANRDNNAADEIAMVRAQVGTLARQFNQLRAEANRLADMDVSHLEFGFATRLSLASILTTEIEIGGIWWKRGPWGFYGRAHGGYANVFGHDEATGGAAFGMIYLLKEDRTVGLETRLNLGVTGTLFGPQAGMVNGLNGVFGAIGLGFRFMPTSWLGISLLGDLGYGGFARLNPQAAATGAVQVIQGLDSGLNLGALFSF